MKRIEMEQAAQIRAILALSRSRGVDPVQVLDEGRLLRHNGTKSEDGAFVLGQAVRILRELPVPHDVKTPLDMKNMFLAVLERMSDAYAAY